MPHADAVAVSLFGLGVAGVFYIYAGYPALIAIKARLFPKPVAKNPAHRATVSIVIAAYNEAPRLADKVRNLVALDGADQIVDILIGSDGSTDDPAAALSGIGDARVRLFAFPARRGKPAVLNDLMAQVRGNIVVMLDARQRIEAGALRALLANFADPAVGVVSGELVFVHRLDDTAGVVGIGAYWRYEKWIRKAEARAGSVPGATGAIYAIRAALLKPMPADLVLDDVVLPMQAVVAGARCVFEPGAVAYDVPAADVRKESVRKRRTIAGCIQLMFRRPAWCLPWVNPIAGAYVSHKLLRVFSPWLMLLSLAASLWLSGQPFYRAMAWLQGAGLAVGLLAMALEKSRVRLPLLGIAGVFLALQFTIVAAWCDYLGGRTRAAWDVSGTRGRAGGGA